MAKQTFTTGQVLTAAQMTSLQQTAMGGGEATAKTTSYVLVAADAGTTVIMNAAGATTITVNTALFAAGDTVNIQNIGAGICTVTAGTATVNTAGSLALTQYEGGVLYFRSTSASTFFDYVQTGSVSPLTTKGDLYGFSTLDARIPIGTNNQVLTADSAQALGLKWATPAGWNPNYTLISTTNLSGSTTVTVSVSGLNSIFLLIGGSSAGANNGVSVRLNTDSGANYGLTYWEIVGSTTTPAATGLGGADAFLLGNQGNNQANTLDAMVQLEGTNATGNKLMQWTSYATGTNAGSRVGNGIYTGASAVTSISVIGYANFDAGSVKVYGA
jgi:hypothetical protein